MPEPATSSVRPITIEDRLGTYRKEHGRHGMVGLSEPMLRMYRLLDTTGHSQAKMLVYGENGTGKEMVAKAIHYLYGNGAEMPFVALNCSAFPDDILESMLFGHRKGSFTGAVTDQTGLFTLANNGTLFLDEIAEMPPHLQTKLLRVLEDGEVRPIGYTKPIKVDVRVVSATNADLAKAISEGRFRQDLYYRLNTVEIHVPALRDRTEDIKLLAEYFGLEFSAKYPTRYAKITEDGFSYLQTQAWPGNVRELRNFMERSILLNVHNLPMDAAYFGRLPKGEYEISRQLELERRKLGILLSLADIEKVLIARSLIETGGNRSRAAKLLGIRPNTLSKRLGKLGITGNDELVEIAATPLYDLNHDSPAAPHPANAEYAPYKPRMELALAAPTGASDISIEGSIARALAEHSNLHALARQEGFGTTSEDVKRVGDLVRRLERIGQDLSAAQGNSQSSGNNHYQQDGNEPRDYFSHRFYQEAVLSEIILHIAHERLRIKDLKSQAADSLKVSRPTYIGWIKGYGHPRSRIPLHLGHRWEKPVIDNDSYYGNASREEIEQNIIRNRYQQLGLRKVPTAQSLRIGIKKLEMALRGFTVRLP